MKIYCFLIFFIPVLWCFSQEVEFSTSFHHITADNGLSSAEVYKVFQDSKGNMWFCTEAGVTKYDGHYFRTYTQNDGLINNVVLNAYEDNYGRIWFMSLSNELCYFEKDSIYPYTYNDVINKSLHNSTGMDKNIYIDKEGSLLYAVDRNGLIKIDKYGNLKNIHTKPGAFQINKFGKKDVPSLQLSVNHSRISTVNLYTSDKKTSNSKNKLLGSFLGGKDYGCLWNTSNKPMIIIGSKLINTETGKIYLSGVTGAGADTLDQNTIWVAGSKGIKKYSIDTDTLIYKASYLDNNYVTSFCRDIEGGMWFSTANNGVFYTNNFDVFYADNLTGLSKLGVVSITKHKDTMHYGFYGGFQKDQSRNGFIENHKSRSKVLLASNNDWFAVSNISNTFSRYSKRANVPYARDLLLKEDYLYLVSSRIYRYDLKNGDIDTLYNYFVNNNEDQPSFFRALEVLPNGAVIAGNQMGISELAGGVLKNDFWKSNTLDVSDLLYSETYGLIVATRNKGVVIFKEGEIIRELNLDNGLLSNNVSCLYELDSKSIIMGTSNGLNFINSSQAKVGMISKNQGIEHADIRSIHEDANFVYLGSRDGVYRINKDVFKRSHQPSKSSIYLESINVNDKKWEGTFKDVTLPYTTERIHVRFRTTNYANWHNKNYQYRLSGNERWIDIGAPDILIYKPIGHFNLEVRYLKTDNKWSRSMVLMSGNIALPFWKRWYFNVFVTVVIIALIVFFAKKRQNRIEHKLRTENELISLEQRMQNARMNPHFIFNILNSIHSFLLFEEKEKAEKYLLKFSSLMRGILENTKSGSISIENETMILEKYLELEKMRGNNLFNYTVENKTGMNTTKIPTMMLQPFVENALLHGISSSKGSGTIRLELNTISEHAIKVSIFDNGVFNKDIVDIILKSDESHAIGITQKRLKNHNTLQNTDVYGVSVHEVHTPEKGKEIVLILPKIIIKP